MVSLRLADTPDRHRSGGTLIAPEFVLTTDQRGDSVVGDGLEAQPRGACVFDEDCEGSGQ